MQDKSLNLLAKVTVALIAILGIVTTIALILLVGCGIIKLFKYIIYLL